MTSGQWTVVGLILFLILLEVGRSPTVKGFFTGFYASFKANTGSKPSGK